MLDFNYNYNWWKTNSSLYKKYPLNMFTFGLDLLDKKNKDVKSDTISLKYLKHFIFSLFGTRFYDSSSSVKKKYPYPYSKLRFTYSKDDKLRLLLRCRHGDDGPDTGTGDDNSTGDGGGVLDYFTYLNTFSRREDVIDFLKIGDNYSKRWGDPVVLDEEVCPPCQEELEWGYEAYTACILSTILCSGEGLSSEDCDCGFFPSLPSEPGTGPQPSGTYFNMCSFPTDYTALYLQKKFKEIKISAISKAKLLNDLLNFTGCDLDVLNPEKMEACIINFLNNYQYPSDPVQQEVLRRVLEDIILHLIDGVDDPSVKAILSKLLDLLITGKDFKAVWEIIKKIIKETITPFNQ